MMEVEKLQRYDLVERIAAGGMGEVFRARATGPHGFEKTLAVKRILPELASDSEFVERFVRESKLAVSLSHANIVQVFDLGRAGDDLFLVMEYVNGTDLARLLLTSRASGRPFPLSIALLIVAEAAQGLAYAHGRYDLEAYKGQDGGSIGVIHCDISPSNLLLSYAGEVKLTDFGVAQLVDHTRRTPAEAQLVMGKWRYMAPEQIRGEPVDGRTDLYALGVVLYEMLAGRKAYGGDGVKATCDQVLAGGAPPVRTYRPEVPEALDRLVARVMAVDPRERPADAREFINEIGEIQRVLPDRVTSLDLGGLVRELVPPTPDSPRRGGLAALFQPMVVERTGDRTAGSQVRRRKPAASFVTRTEGTDSHAITQWIPASQPVPDWAGLGRFAFWQRRLKWRLGSAFALVGCLLAAAMGVGLATGLKMRRPQQPMPEPAAQQEPRAPSVPDDSGVQRLLPNEALPHPPVERIPRELASLLPNGHGPSLGAIGADRAAVRPRGSGFLDIYVEPWANVTLDGRQLEKPTPLTRLAVRPGIHRLLLANPVLHKSKSVDVTVAEGQTQKVEVYLVEK